MAGRALTLVVLLAACGVELGEPPDVGEDDGKSDGTGPGSGSGGGTGSGGQMPLTATTFLTRIGTQYCDECFRCQATYPGPNPFAQDFGATKPECYAGTAAYYEPQVVEQSITAGRVIFNAGAAKTCMDGITYAQSCAAFWETGAQLPSACNVALLGTVADNGTCASLFDCANLGSFCDPATKQCLPR